MSPGEIRNRARAEQGRDFTGLCFGNITPTDIDGVLDFGGQRFVFMEAKFGRQGLPRGQELCLENLCKGYTRTRKKAIALVLEHNTPPEQQIDFATCRVRRFYTATLSDFGVKGEWQTPHTKITCRAFIDNWLQTCMRVKSA